MKRKNTSLMLMAGLVVSILTYSQAVAFSEEDMMEGIDLSVVNNDNNKKSYKYDNTMIGAEESMTEFIFFPKENTIEQRYAGDPSSPDAKHMMVEGICLDQLSKEIASR